MEAVAQLAEQHKVLRLPGQFRHISIGQTSPEVLVRIQKFEDYHGQKRLTTINLWVVGSNPTCFTKRLFLGESYYNR
jgi:hypothetical protein